MIPLRTSVTSQSIQQSDGTYQPVFSLGQYYIIETPEQYILDAGCRGEYLQTPLGIWTSKISMYAGQPINRAIMNTLSHSLEYRRQWAGVVVVVKYSDSTQTTVCDTVQEDLEHVVAYFHRRCYFV